MADKPKRSANGVSRTLVFAFIIVSLASMVIGGLIVFLVTAPPPATSQNQAVNVESDCSFVLPPTYPPNDSSDAFELTATALIYSLTVTARGDCDDVATATAHPTQLPPSAPTCLPPSSPPTSPAGDNEGGFDVTATALIWQLTQDASAQICATPPAPSK